MEKSDHYYLRKRRMKYLETPKISEAIRELGNDLTDALLATCPEPLKRVFGMTPLLKGPGNDLWISPSDVLIGNVCLKPPLTDRHMKALTHEGILLIGRDTEIKVRNEAELEKRKALLEQEEMLLFIAELEKRKAVLAARKEEKAKCEREKQEMRLAFELRLQYELEQLTNKLRIEYEQLMIQQREILNNEWQLKLEAAVAETVTKLTEQFLNDLAEQEKELLRKFSVEIKKEQIKRKMDVKHVENCCQETFLQLKHQLECKNIANMMYIICMERRKCQAEREHMETSYQKQVEDLQALLADKEVEITGLTKQLEEKIKQVNLREECLLEILRQFQKFINFALRASPTQAEFLLSIEKMMVFELTEALAETDKKHAKRLTRTLFPWKTESETTPTTLSRKDTVKSLRPDDHHECYNEIEPPESIHSCKSDDYLPAFHYDKHMYVREEFRNMMSQGIKLSPSNLIWNRDVEHLMKILRRSVTSMEEEETLEEEQEEEKEEQSEKSSIKKEEVREKQVEIKEELTQERRQSRDESSTSSKDSSIMSKTRPPRRSIVYFKSSKGDDDFLFPIFESTSAIKTTQSEMYEEMAGPQPEEIDPDMIIDGECCKPCVVTRPTGPSTKVERESAVPLIGTRNSLELFKEADNLSDTYREVTGILCAQDSLHKHRMSLKPTNILLSSRESIEVSEVIALQKRSRRSSSYVETMRRSSTASQRSTKKSESSFRRISRDSKIHFRLKDQPLPKESSESLQVPEDKTKKDVLTMSKLSLARDSFIVHKHSLILKRQSAQNIPKEERQRLASEDTIQLKKTSKPGSAQDIADRSSLKKSSKSRLSYDTASYSTPSKTPSMYKVRSLTELGYPTSKLTMSRDSLDLLRLQPKLSGISRDKHKVESKESIEIKDGILGLHIDGTQSPLPIIKLDDDGSRTVKMSHIEILPFEKHPSTDIVEEEPSITCSVFKTQELINSDSPWLIYEKKESDVQLPELPPPPRPRDNFLTKPNIARIGGDKKASGHFQKGEEFTLHRAGSLLSVFRKHPSLIKMFTSCTK